MPRPSRWWVLPVLTILLTQAVVPSAQAHPAPRTRPADAASGAVGYAYDAAGRLAGVSQDQAGAAAYDYDADGNLTAVHHSAASALSVLSMVPAAAAPGATVTLRGTGFAVPAEGDTVAFGGAEATVTAATPTALTVTVPDGASTGPVSVTTSAGTASSRGSFTVRAAPGPLTVTAVSPEAGTPGTSVTISGTGFDASAAGDTVSFGRTRALITAAGPTSLTATVPGSAGSGPVSVATGGRVATSGDPFTVVPDTEFGTNVESEAAITVDGPPTSVSVAKKGKFALVRFDGVRGQRLSLGATEANLSYNAFLDLFDPTSTPFARGEFSAGPWVDDLGGAYDLPPLPMTGTYEIAVVSAADTIGPVTLTLSGKVAGALAVGGAGTPVAFTRPGQETELSLPLTKGQHAELGFDQTSYTADETATATIHGPNGTPVLWDSSGSTSGRLRTNGASDYDLTAGETGTYTVVLAPSDGKPGSFTVTASTSANGGSLALGTVKTVALGRPGQDTTLTYAGTINQELGIDISNITTSYRPYLTVTGPSGQVLFSNQLDGHTDLAPLPATGTYTVTVSTYSATGSVGLKLATRTAAGSLTPTGPAAVARVTGKGDDAQLKFSATKDVPVSFAFTNLGFPAGATVDAVGIDPDGDDEVEYDGLGNTSGFSFTPDHTGQYRLQVSADDDKSTGSVTVTMATEIAGGALSLGVEQPLTAPRPGQSTRYTFPGTKGQSLGFVLGSSTFNQYLHVKILRPDGQTLWDGTTWDEVDLTSLPSTGTYQAVVTPYGESGSGQVRIAPRESFPAAAIGGAAANLSVGLQGGIAETSFSAKASERISVASDGSDFDGPAVLRLYAPDGSLMVDGYFFNEAFINLTTGAAGNYRMEMVPLDGDYGSSSVTLSDQAGAGSISLNSAKTVTLARTGQNTYLTYQGSSGQKLALSFSKMTARSRPYVSMTAPDGSSVVSTGGSDNPVAIGPLPANGTYELDLNPFDDTGSVTLTLAKTASAASAKAAAPASASGQAVIVSSKPSRALPKAVTLPKGGAVTHKPSGNRGVPVPSRAAKSRSQAGARPACATCSPGTPPPPTNAPPPGGTSTGGDPVDLATGMLDDSETDLSVNDTIPLTVARNYQQSDTGLRDFGVGDSSDYDMFLYAPDGAVSSQLVLPNGSRVSFQRVTPGGSGAYDYADAVYTAVPTPTKFDGALMAWNGNGFDVRLHDGTTLVFGENAPLQAIRDRFGNTVTIIRGPGTRDEDTGQVQDNGPILQVTSPHGRWITFTHDALKRITSATDNTGRRVGYTYDAHGHLATATGPTGAVSSYTYDSAGRMATAKDARGVVYLTNTYDANNRVSKQVLGDGGTYQFTYVTDAADHLTETRLTDQRGTVRRVTYNAQGYSTSDTTAYGTSLAQTTTLTRDPVSNLPTSTTDPLGRRTDQTFDAYGNPLTLTEQAGTSSARTERRAYDGPFGQLSSSTDWLGRVTAYTYRPDGSPATVTDPLGRVTTAQTDGDGLLTRITDASGQSTSLTYVLGDLATTTDPLGRVKTSVADAAGWADSTTDPLGATTVTTHDADGRVLTSTDPLGRTTAMTYDADGNVTKVVDARGNATTYAYDPENRLTGTTDPLARVTSQTYDAAGNRTATKTGSGQTTYSDYDALGRLTATRYSDSTITYSYDKGNRIVSVVDSKNGTITDTYDGFDRKTRVTTPSGRIDYAYDGMDERTSATVAGAQPVGYTFDADGEMTGLTQGANSVAIGYDAVGRRSSVKLPAGIVESYTYDAAGEVTGIGYDHGGTSTGALTYTYDAAGRPVSVGGSLARVTIPGDYGPAAYDAANELTAVGTTAYTYDGDGNPLSAGNTAYTWNTRGQLASTTSGGATTGYAYDALGRRTGKTDTRGTVNYLYDGPNPVEELTGGTVTASTLTGGTDEVFARTSGGATRSLLTDRLGSTVGVADASGSVTGQYTYEPFGATTMTGDDGGNPTQFAGRENDGGGQYFNRARYYSTSNQRFLSQDPTGFAGGDTNVYAYTGDQPTTMTDPFGLSSQQSGQGGSSGGSFWGSVGDFSLSGLSTLWENRSSIEIGLAVVAIAATAVGAVVSAPVLATVATVAVVAGVALSVADTANACYEGEKLACGAGIAGVAFAGEGVLVDKLGEKFLESLTKTAGEEVESSGPALTNVWNWGSIAFTAVGGFFQPSED
jgi:RHS repeat-associated protein